MPPRLGAMGAKLKPAAKVAEPFYRSKAWRELVARRKLDPDYFEARRRAKAGERLILDHVDERRDGGVELDAGNTRWLTFSEHQAKTAAARARRAHGPPA